MSFWRKEDPIIKDGHVTKGGMWSYQREWWQSDKFFKLLVGGYGSGKTAISAKRAIALAIYNAPSPYLYVSPTYSVAQDTIVPHIETMLDGRGIKYDFHSTKLNFTIYYAGKVGKIWIRSGDRPKKLKGPNIGAANIDEPFIQEKSVFDQVMARVRDPRSRLREISMTGTPEELNWGYEMCEGDDLHKYADRLAIIKAKTEENLALPPEYVQTLKASYDPLMAQAYLDGEFVSLDDNLVYHSFSDANIVDVEYSPNLPIEVGMDFNVNPMSCVIFQKRNGVYHAIDEIVLKKSHTADMCQRLLEKYPRQIFTIAPDASGGNNSTKGTTDFAIIRKEMGSHLDELIHPRSNPRVKDRFNCVNAALCNSDGLSQLFVSPKCKELIKDFKQISHPFDEYKRKNEKHGRVHTSDAAGYLIHRRLPLASKPTLRMHQ